MSIENKSNNKHSKHILRQDTAKTDGSSSKNYFSSLADKYSKASHILYIA